jgi:NADH-quinone oxidoreductase subunit L
MRKMGGLRKFIPRTYWTLLAGAIALAGIFPFAGFWSKDEILGMNFKEGAYIVWGIGLVAAFITAFYTFRLIFMTFFGESRMDPEVEHHVHESPWSMVGPLAILAVLSAGAGVVLGVPPEGGLFAGFLEPVFEPANRILGVEHHGLAAIDYILMAVSLAVALSGIALAYLFYMVKPKELPQRAGAAAGPLYRAIYYKWYVDEIYNAVIINPLINGSRWLWRTVDAGMIDATVNGVGRLWELAGRAIRPAQTGGVHNYAAAMFAGVFIVISAVLIFVGA